MLPIKEYIAHPNILGMSLLKKYGLWLPDSIYLRLLYRFKMGKPLHLRNPQTFNEKLQWLKLYNRRPEYTTMVDKYAVKDYVASIIGGEFIIPTIGVWDNPEDIEWNKLPDKFVLKTTHGGGSEGVVICKDKDSLDKEKVIKQLKKGLRQDVYKYGKEWPYKNVPRRIIAEEYIEEENGELNDYKVFNFNGEPKVIQVDYNRFKGHLRNLYNTDWEKIDATIEYPSDPNKVINKPAALSQLLDLAKKLSVSIPHVRTDFYIVENKVYFGEMTFFHGSGFEHFSPDSFERVLGDWIVLPINKTGGFVG